MHTRMHNTYVCLAIYCMINCATITVVINVKKEFVHHLSCCRVSYTHRTMRFMALHACTSQINFKSCPVQCGSSVPVWVNTTSGLSALSADNQCNRGRVADATGHRIQRDRHLASPALMVRSVHSNRMLFGPLKLQLSRYQIDVEYRNKLIMQQPHVEHRRPLQLNFGTLVETDQLGSRETYGGGTEQQTVMPLAALITS